LIPSKAKYLKPAEAGNLSRMKKITKTEPEYIHSERVYTRLQDLQVKKTFKGKKLKIS